MKYNSYGIYKFIKRTVVVSAVHCLIRFIRVLTNKHEKDSYSVETSMPNSLIGMQELSQTKEKNYWKQ